jgi:hypothetical protein
MELEIYDNLPCPMWAILEKNLNEKFGRKFTHKIGHMMRETAGVLRTYYKEVFNPINKKDFKEKYKIEILNGKILNGL